MIYHRTLSIIYPFYCTDTPSFSTILQFRISGKGERVRSYRMMMIILSCSLYKMMMILTCSLYKIISCRLYKMMMMILSWMMMIAVVRDWSEMMVHSCYTSYMHTNMLYIVWYDDYMLVSTIERIKRSVGLSCFIYPSTISIYHIYHIYTSYLSIISIYHIYISYLSIISIYHIYLSYLSTILIFIDHSLQGKRVVS